MKLRYFIYLLLVLVLLNIGLYAYYLYRAKSRSYLACPVPKEYCKQGKIIEYNGIYFGVGYRVPAGTPVLAVIGGQIQGSGVSYTEELGGGRFPGLMLTDYSNGQRVSYILTGEGYSVLADVSQSEEIVKSREGNIANFEVNLLVTVHNNNDSGEPVKLSPRNFKAK